MFTRTPASDVRLAEFAAMIRRVAGVPRGTGPGAPDPAGFSDEMGHRRPVDAPFLAWRSRRKPGKCEGESLDVRAWWSVASDPVDLGALRGMLASHRPGPGGFGALSEQSAHQTIEVWSETELSTLHALWWVWVRTGDGEMGKMLVEAARWHIAHLQPDNATNHPWAAHVFAALDACEGVREAGLYAQTLVHNCQTALGRPDRLSVQILADAAEAVELMLEG